MSKTNSKAKDKKAFKGSEEDIQKSVPEIKTVTDEINLNINNPDKLINNTRVKPKSSKLTNRFKPIQPGDDVQEIITVVNEISPVETGEISEPKPKSPAKRKKNVKKPVETETVITEIAKETVEVQEKAVEMPPVRKIIPNKARPVVTENPAAENLPQANSVNLPSDNSAIQSDKTIDIAEPKPKSKAKNKKNLKKTIEPDPVKTQIEEGTVSEPVKIENLTEILKEPDLVAEKAVDATPVRKIIPNKARPVVTENPAAENIPAASTVNITVTEDSANQSELKDNTEAGESRKNYLKNKRKKWNKKKFDKKSEESLSDYDSESLTDSSTGLTDEEIVAILELFSGTIEENVSIIENPPSEETPQLTKSQIKNRRKKKKKNPKRDIPAEEAVAAAQAEETGTEVITPVTEDEVVPQTDNVNKVNPKIIIKSPAVQQPKSAAALPKHGINKKENVVPAALPKTENKQPKPVIKQKEEGTASVPKVDNKPAKPVIKPKEPPKAKPAKIAPAKKTEFVFTVLPANKQMNKTQSANEFLQSFLSKVEDYLRQEAFIESGGKLLAAVSGGVDSVVMMDAMALLADRMRFSLYVAHFNHKLRGFSSDNDEVLVRSASKEYNIQFYSGVGNVKQYSSKNSISIEHAARILRYNFFERTARNVGVDLVATAHTEDDLVETFFINLFRGSGLTGLSSMPSKRKFVKNVTLVRPFLQFSKKELYEYAKIRKLKWNEDETNSLLNYTRNKIRHDLIPKLVNEYNPSLIDIINRTAQLFQGADEVIKDLVSKSITNVIDESNNERFQLKVNMMLTFNRFMQGELIQYAWNKYFRLQPLPLSAIDRILDLTSSQTGAICEISSGYFVLRDRNHLIFAKKTKQIDSSLIIDKPGEYKLGKYKLEIREVKPEDVKFSDDKNVEYIPAELMEPFVEIRSKRDGDDFTPLGSPGEMKLSDFLTNEKVPLVDKPNILIMTNKIDILWVLGYRISDIARIRKSTQRIYRLKLINTEKK